MRGFVYMICRIRNVPFFFQLFLIIEGDIMLFCLLMNLETDQDRVSFRVLYEKTVNRFLVVAKSILHNQDDAEEVVHDIYTDWMKDYRKYRRKPLNEMTALGVVMVRNRAINLKRRKNNYMERPVDDPDIYTQNTDEGDQGVLEMMIRNETVESVKQAIKSLTEDEQTILKLRYELEMSRDEIATVMKTNSNTVKKRLQRVRKKLSILLNELNYEEG